MPIQYQTFPYPEETVSCVLVSIGFGGHNFGTTRTEGTGKLRIRLLVPLGQHFSASVVLVVHEVLSSGTETHRY